MGVRSLSLFTVITLALTTAGTARAEFALPLLPLPRPARTPLIAEDEKPSEAKPKRIGSTPMEVLHATPSGRLLVRSANNTALYLWRADRPGLQAVRDSKGIQVTGENYDVTPSGRQLFVKDSLYATETTLHLIDLESDNLSSMGYIESRGYTGLPVFNEDDSVYAFFESASSAGRSGWLFPIAEYRFDLERNSAQPTGFYLHKLLADQLKDNVTGGTFSPEGGRLGLLTGVSIPTGHWGYSRFGYYPIGPDGSYPPLSTRSQGTSFAVFDLATGTTETVPLDHGANSVHWTGTGTGGDEIYLTRGSRGYITRVRVQDKMQERVWKEEVERAQISADGDFAFFKPVREKDEGHFILLNLRNRDAFTFQGAKGGIFAADSKSLVVARTSVPSGQPFYRVDLTPYRERSVGGETNIEVPGKYTSLGEGMAVWEVPHDKVRFENNIDWGKPSLTKLADMGWDLYIAVRNKGAVFLGFDTKQAFGLVCELVDSNDKVLVTWLPEFNDAPKQTPPRLGPNEWVRLDCGVALDKALPPLFTGKIRYYLREYEEATRGEIAVP